jgi:cyclopropane-fatty-acyl-phospholipid synthase
MTYSCGVFDSPDTDLRTAQKAKLDSICRQLDLEPHHRVLEIGTGWGSFALHAAREYGCRVTTTTISREQRTEAERRVREAGLADRIEILSEDYRNLTGRYDRLVSIEMIEAVGHRHLGTFFAKCAELLEDDGVLLLQAITMPDRDWEHYVRTADFIQLWVFPGSCCPSLGAMQRAWSPTDLRVDRVESIGPHYERTLRLWRERFLARREDAAALGHDTRFLRLWEYYLAYCEAGFAERYVDDLQIRLARPGWRGDGAAGGVAGTAATGTGGAISTGGDG